jgi:hypothetical protein
MTTNRSPLRKLRRQSDIVAQKLKAAERGEIALKDGARDKPNVTFSVVMDHKCWKFEMSWEEIRSSSEAAISDLVLKHMRA